MESDAPLVVDARGSGVLRERPVVSEVWFGRATEEDLQANIDGLSFDEAPGLVTATGIPAFLVTWFLTRRAHTDHHLQRIPTSSAELIC